MRTETAIGNGQVSVPSVAVDLTRSIFGDLSGHKALLVGSGEMAEAVARLLKVGGTSMVVVGRTLSRAEELAAAVGGSARPWEALQQSLVEADVVVTSTSAPHHVIDFDMVSAARKSRRGRSQFFIDLAVPRDVDPRIESLDGEFLYNIDDLSKVVSETLSTPLARSRVPRKPSWGARPKAMIAGPTPNKPRPPSSRCARASARRSRRSCRAASAAS